MNFSRRTTDLSPYSCPAAHHEWHHSNASCASPRITGGQPHQATAVLMARRARGENNIRQDILLAGAARRALPLQRPCQLEGTPTQPVNWFVYSRHSDHVEQY